MIDQLQRFGQLLAFLLALTSPATLAAAQDTPTTGEPATNEPAPETAAAQVDERFASPWATMSTYLTAMEKYRQSGREDDLKTALLAFDFSGVDLAETQRQTAANLLNILNRINMVDSWQFPEPEGDRFVYFPQDWISAHKRVAALVPGAEIAFAKQKDGRWLISKDTVEHIPEFYRRIENLKAEYGDGEIALTPAMLIRSRMPESLRKGEVLGVEYWQWIGLGLLVFLGLVLDLLVRMVLRKVWRRIEHKRGQETTRELLNRAVRPFGMLASALLWYGALPLVGLPPTAVSVILIAVKVVLMLSGVWAAWRLTDLLADFLERQADKTQTKLDDLLIPLARKTGKVIVAAFGLIYIAQSFDIEILPLLTGLGIGGLAFAFAAKDTIENFFGSVAVVLDQPFEVGDWVVIDGTEGTVEELGLRSTRIRTFYDSLITIPNATLVRARVDNYGKRRYRRLSTTLGVTYDTTPEQIEAFCEGIREIIRQHPYTRKDYFHVYLNSWGDFALNILLYVFFECPDWSVELRERQRLMLDIMRLAERLGVSFAFPTQTLEIKRAGSTSVPATLETITSPSAEIEAQRIGIETTRSMFESASWKRSKPGPVVFRGSSATEARGSSGDGEG
jgi:MscS family membrane protein